jgi:hypothetical protein
MAQQPNDGDIYVNPGITDVLGGAYYPGEPEERKAAEKDQAAPVAASYPIMEDVAEWFKQQIASCDDMHNIQVSKMTIGGTVYERSISVEAQVLAYQLLKEKLTDKFNTFKDFSKETDA